MVYIVCVRDVSAGEDTYLGPFRSFEQASRVRRRLVGDITARQAQDVFDALIEEVQPGYTVEDFRNKLLGDLDALGYVQPSRAS